MESVPHPSRVILFSDLSTGRSITSADLPLSDSINTSVIGAIDTTTSNTMTRCDSEPAHDAPKATTSTTVSGLTSLQLRLQARTDVMAMPKSLFQIPTTLSMCHSCRQSLPWNTLIACGGVSVPHVSSYLTLLASTGPVCSLMFCAACLAHDHQIDGDRVLRSTDCWECPKCTNTCKCRACANRRRVRKAGNALPPLHPCNGGSTSRRASPSTLSDDSTSSSPRSQSSSPDSTDDSAKELGHDSDNVISELQAFVQSHLRPFMDQVISPLVHGRVQSLATHAGIDVQVPSDLPLWQPLHPQQAPSAATSQSVAHVTACIPANARVVMATVVSAAVPPVQTSKTRRTVNSGDSASTTHLKRRSVSPPDGIRTNARPIVALPASPMPVLPVTAIAVPLHGPSRFRRPVSLI